MSRTNKKSKKKAKPSPSRKTQLRKSGYLEDYRLEDAYLVRPDRPTGRPGVYRGFSPDGEPILVKVWPRARKNPDDDLKEIWRYEVRQLHRLAGYPGASDYIAHLRHAGFDDQGFYLVVSPGQRLPLSAILSTAKNNHWLKVPRQPANRVRLWRNLRRLSCGIETLHAQGILHRNIDASSVLTAGGEDPDFQLTGFEWSMRLVGPAGLSSLTVTGYQGALQQYSFLQDWLLFGLLTADLLGVKRERLFSRDVPPHEIAEHLHLEEARLLRTIVQLDPPLRLDGDVIQDKIDDVLRVLAADVANRDPKLHITMRLDIDSPLAQAIRSASDNAIEMDDTSSQLQFIRQDLSQSPLLLAIKPWPGALGLRLAIRGRNLIYQLQQYRHPTSWATPTWEFAYCDDVDRSSPAGSMILGHHILDPSALSILNVGQAKERFPRLRGKLTSWTEWLQKFSAESEPLSQERKTHRALVLTQLLEAIIAATDVYPVQILATPHTLESDGDVTLRVRPRPDADRLALSKALGLQSPAIRLANILKSENIQSENWILTDSKSLGEKNPNDTEWRLHEIQQDPGKPEVFVFKGTAPVPLLQDSFLVPEGSVGRDTQFRRRLKALRALGEHRELLWMITDPRKRLLDSHDVFFEDDEFTALDEPKQLALKELTATIPLYLVQGPPGVGKTRLVRDLVRRRFNEESMTRILLTAQSNAAIDHLMHELAAVLEPDSKDGPLVVRCRSKESVNSPSPFEIGVQTRAMVGRLSSSKMAISAKPHIRTLLARLTAVPDDDSTATSPSLGAVAGRSISQAFRAIEGLVARAANVVFATTNSAELERLIDERGQFDWSVVEEAGKATGCELVPPMLLSHRRLMIGDHKQLAPFGSEQLVKILESPESIREALAAGREFVGRTLRDATTEEILDEIDEENSTLPALCADALRVLTLFENVIEAEFDRQTTSSRGRPIAKKLIAQHRMHPTICNLVSRCFYGYELETHPKCAERFQRSIPPYRLTDGNKIQLCPISVIDMPYVQATVGQKHGDRFPRWNNPDEVDAAISFLAQIRGIPTKKAKPTLAVLSPYYQQVVRLRSAIADANMTTLSHLTQFHSATGSDDFCATVDSFQGSEADIVVISLVRNNQHANPMSALGFLSNPRRMNVLLSRARWMLVLIASLDFFSTVLNAARGTKDEEQIAFLSEMLDELFQGKQKKLVSFLPLANITGAAG